MVEVQLHLRCRPDLSPEAMETALARQDAGRAPSSFWAMRRLPDNALPALAHAAGRHPALPDYIVSLGEGEEAATDAIALAAALMPLLALEGSSLALMDRHVILPGRDRIRLFFGLRRLLGLTLGEFHDYWLNHHADYGRRMIPPYSYHQLHARPRLAAALAAAAGLPASDLDGSVEVDFPDVDALVRQLSRPDVAQDALADERRFIDHGRSMIWGYELI